MRRTVHSLLFLVPALLIWTCDLSNTPKKDTLTFRLNDSLMVAAGKYDSVRLDLYAV
jgi:hypothetical protein